MTTARTGLHDGKYFYDFKEIVMLNGTVPSGAPADGVSVYSQNYAADGTAQMIFWGEEGGKISIPSSASDDVVVLVDLAQTLTLKTLTEPTIDGGAFSGIIAGAHTYSGVVTFSFPLSGASPTIDLNSILPGLQWTETDAGTDQTIWRLAAIAGQLRGYITDDNVVNTINWLEVERSGTGAAITIDSVTFPTGLVAISDTTDATSTTAAAFTVAGGVGIAGNLITNHIIGLGSNDLEAWVSGGGVIQADYGALWFHTDHSVFLTSNAYFDSVWKYRATFATGVLGVTDNLLTYRQAASGTIDTAITWTTPFAIDSSGNTLLNGATAGSSAAGVLAIANGTAPSTIVAGVTQIWAADINSLSALHIMPESDVATIYSFGEQAVFTQGDTTRAGIAPLKLSQLDVSEALIDFVCAIGTGNGIEAVAAKNLTVTHFVKMLLPGALERYIEVGTIA